MADRLAIVAEAEGRDYDLMPLSVFMDYIRTTISPDDIADFAEKAAEKAKAISTMFDKCPTKCTNQAVMRQLLGELIVYTLKSAEINKEAAMWLAVELENVSIYGR